MEIIANNFISLAEMTLAFAGFIIIYFAKRKQIYKFKVCIVYSILLFYGLGGLFNLLTAAEISLFNLMFIYCLSLLHWREMSNTNNKLDRLHLWLNSVMQVSPDMIWIKDMDNRFLYTNQVIREKLLLTDDTRYPIGKTGVEIALDLKGKGITYSAGSICLKSDDITKEKNESCLFLEDFVINGKKMYLLVHKKPIYKEGKMVGTVGTGRVVTDQVEEHKELWDLYKNGELKQFEELFEKHVNKYYFTDVPESKLIKIFE